jgi:hypothetical protein
MILTKNATTYDMEIGQIISRDSEYCLVSMVLLEHRLEEGVWCAVRSELTGGSVPVPDPDRRTTSAQSQSKSRFRKLADFCVTTREGRKEGGMLPRCARKLCKKGPSKG